MAYFAVGMEGYGYGGPRRWVGSAAICCDKIVGMPAAGVNIIDEGAHSACFSDGASWTKSGCGRQWRVRWKSSMEGEVW